MQYMLMCHFTFGTIIRTGLHFSMSCIWSEMCIQVFFSNVPRYRFQKCWTTWLNVTDNYSTFANQGVRLAFMPVRGGLINRKGIFGFFSGNLGQLDPLMLGQCSGRMDAGRALFAEVRVTSSAINISLKKGISNSATIEKALTTLRLHQEN